MKKTPDIPQNNLSMSTQSTERTSWLKLWLISKDEPRLRAGWRLAAQAVLLICTGLIFSILISLVIAVLPEGALTFSYLSVNISTLVSLGAVTLSVFLARRYIDQRPFISLGVKWDSQALSDLLFGLLLPGVMMGSIYLVERSLGWLRFENFNFQGATSSSIFSSLLWWFVLFSAVGWSEELLVRGYWLQNIAEGLNLPAGVVLSSLIFALLHWQNPEVSLQAIIGLLFSGLFLAYGYVSTGQLWLPIGLHLGWNFFEGVIFGFPVSGLNTFRLIRHQVIGPELWTGGAFGPEAGLIMLPTLGLGTAIIYWYSRQRPLNSR